MKILESGENYLETIYIQIKEHGQIRSVDLANALGFSKPSISVAVHSLKDDGYIELDADGFITLTDKGTDIARKIYDRHEIIAQFLISIGVDSEAAYADSCKIEHDISDISFAKIKEHYLKNK